MAKDLSQNVLFDFYAELLTDKQAEAMDCYYNQDLSLAEIAEQMQVSRQGVRAFIKHAEAHLCEFEEKLHLAKRFIEISKTADDIKNILLEMPNCNEKNILIEKIDEIKQRL